VKFEININEIVEVTLTSYGADVYNSYYSQFKHYRPAERKEGDVLRDSLWSIMQVFGPAIYMGMQPHFKRNTIVFDKEIK
jgi:hypothetical protein